MSLKSELQKIVENTRADAVAWQDGSGGTYGLGLDEATQAILDLLDKSLPKQLDPKLARNGLQDAEVIGYNTALMDVRTVIREQVADVRKVIKEEL